ncbi:DNA mismatch repair protein MutT [Bacterioplanes sanyensis]|uniref:GDP-mannose pyrophosphatase n=1 Tax=Bacterioplanes sanyensis TaxID=1249553 RepID=A0A222FPR6_9GAMM|nr:NUDIX hydrolase [Bacterioplanes sanyensis]ASP40516.1 DNA mismatch repair protein MutT [Bacterioplanes sanyensis]
MSEENPWQVRRCTQVYDNPWLSLEHNDVINPAGKDGIYGVVRFKTKAVAILPIDEQGFTWLVGQYRFAVDQYHWELPMGGAPLGEAPLACAQRELAEETGLIAESWQLLQTLHLSNSVTDEQGFIYLAKGLTQGAAAPEETEQLQVQRIEATTALQWVMDGKITDAMTVAALQGARLRGLI